jgi:predicted HNH restriction endonuclease
VIVTFDHPGNEWEWKLRPNAARALERLGIVSDNFVRLPDEETVSERALLEGKVHRIEVNAYERNPEARRKCLEHYGTSCSVCGFNFEKVYGEIGARFIHVHHLKLLSGIATSYQVDPIRDLRPVCPNCHAMIHIRQGKPPLSIAEIRKLVKA